jgi:hypothetical protein
MQMHTDVTCLGIVICAEEASDAGLDCAAILALFSLQDLASLVDSGYETVNGVLSLRLRLRPSQAMRWAPDFNTLGLSNSLQLDSSGQTADLIREVVITMLIGPIAFEFPSVQELVSAVRIRCNIVAAARKTTLAFHTSEAERPEDCWVHDRDFGFIVRPGCSLIEALMKATQPGVSGALYSFSCYRASEYVLLLGIALELQQCNPALYARLQVLWARRPIKSGEFHQVFLREQGSMEAPLPPYFYVPGDRAWFRNPDEASADVSGFEGSWVMYLGGGLFSNFWKHDHPYTLAAKCLEIYHWRDGLYRDANGDDRLDEARVAVLVERTLDNPLEVARIQKRMQRYREARGIYSHAGGCLDTTREFARWVCPGTTDLLLPSP